MKPRAPALPLAVFCAVLAFLAMGRLAAPARASEIPADQRQAIESIIHDYLLHHPEVMLEALQNAEAKLKRDAHQRAAQMLNAHHRQVFSDPASPVGGNPRGDISIVEFFDYQCPYCKGVEPTLEKLVRKDPQLRFVYKEFPVLGPASMTAARAALAATKQGKYLPFHQALMALKGRLSDARIFAVASHIGLDVARLKQDMAAPAISEAIKKNLALADLLNINGTPAFVIGNEIVPGAAGFEKLKELVAKARKS